MQDPAHVGLVDAHAEGDGGHDDARRAIEERLCGRPASRGRKAGVVERHPMPGVRQRLTRRLRAGVSGGVDDAGPASMDANSAILRCLSAGERT